MTEHDSPTDQHQRPSTPDRITPDGSTTIKLKRACNGCGQHIGDITDLEMTAAIEGQPLPDVRRECPACAPTAPPPACRPTQTVWGDALCVEQACDHDLTDGEYCDEVTEQVVCGTHSETTGLGEITRAAPWPCPRNPAAAVVSAEATR
jgi:hypothetical protein